MKTTSIFFSLLITIALLSSCVGSDDLEVTNPTDPNLVTEGPLKGMNVSDEFKYPTSHTVKLQLTAPDFLKGGGFSLHLSSEESDSIPFASASFDETGSYSGSFELPAINDSITIRSNYVGLTDKITLSLEGGKASFDYRTLYTRDASKSGFTKKTSDPFVQNGFTFLAPFNNQGVPDNLIAPDIIEQNLLDDINASVPENQRLPISHPEYLAGNETNLVLVKEADVWVTFVGEGAGWKNALGYYTYPVGQAPTSPADIQERFIIFPNVSMKGSGGGLVPGDRVYLGRFPANTVVSWFLVANGYTGSGVGTGNGTHYSQPELNSESIEDLKKHMVLLYDPARELSILSFEDVPRDWVWCDQDFNDAIFYAKSNPVDAIAKNNLAEIATENDSDGDGINDELDYFPFDPNIAFNNFAPSASATGTITYEDLWPSKGDYDFNDLVVSYNYNLLANSQGKITRIDATYNVLNIGGAFHNGFAISFPISPDNIASVNNQVITANYLDIDTNGTELGMNPDETVIVVADDTFDLVGQEINLQINFSTPIDKEALGQVPFNPFIIVDGVRAKEVHLPDLAPTSKADFLGTNDDYSDPSVGRYYKTKKNLPWALNVYGEFTPPTERIPINLVYPKFIPWANSGGTAEKSWYVTE